MQSNAYTQNEALPHSILLNRVSVPRLLTYSTSSSGVSQPFQLFALFKEDFRNPK